MSRISGLPMNSTLLIRPRVDLLIEQGLTHPLLVLLAGSGYGKTHAVASHLAKVDGNILWLRLNRLDNLHTHFWNHLARALPKELRSIAKPLQALGFPDTPSKFDAFIQLIADGLSSRKKMIWVFDDFGEVENAQILDFFQMLTDVELDGLHLVLMSSALTSVESIAFLSSEQFLILGKDLRFTSDEIAALYASHGLSLERDELREIERYSEGWPLALNILVLQRKEAYEFIGAHEQVTDQSIFRLFEMRYFSAYSGPQKRLFTKLSLLNSFSLAFAESVCEDDQSAMQSLANHMFIANEPATGRYSFHYLYRLFLQKKRHLLTADEETRFWRCAADYYRSSGDTIETMACCRKTGDHKGMLDAICVYIRMHHGVTAENGAFILEHLDLLSAEDETHYPIALYLRALVHVHMLALEKAENLLLELETMLLSSRTPESSALLAEAWAVQGNIHMMQCREDFGEYFKKACDLLPEGTALQSRDELSTHNNNSFSMADSLPGAKERMERAVHFGVPLMSRFLGGPMSGMEHVFSAEAAYLSFQLDAAEQHAYRAIYRAEAYAQHDLVCNAYYILARIGLMRGDFQEMEKQVQQVTRYAENHENGAVREIRDTTLGWYYLKVRDHSRIPKSILSINHLGRPLLERDRSQITYANYLLDTGEYARLIGMLENPRGLFLENGIWPDRIYLHILLAAGHYQLRNLDAAMRALHSAYEMCHDNGLITLFVEAGGQMENLLSAAKNQNEYFFAPDWIDLIKEQLAAFAVREESVCAAYRRQNPAKTRPDNPLTRREAEVLQALARGLMREEIAAEQFITVNTVKTFIRSIYNKLNAANRVEAVSIAIARGYIDAVPPEQPLR